MKIYRLKNALIFPGMGQGIWDNSTILGVQSVNPREDPKEFGLKLFGRYIVSQRLRKKYSSQNNPIRLSGKYLYLGQLSDHFGHFMEECLGRLWACHLHGVNVDGFIFMQYNETIRLHPYMIEVFNLFEVDSKRLKLVSEFVEVEDLIVPEVGSWLGGEKKWFKGWLEQYIDVRNYKKNLPPKIIIRRSKKFLGRVAGFDYFSNILIENGFREIYPENYSIKEQIEFVVSAKVLVWEQGSACHLLKILPKLKSTSVLIKRNFPAFAIDNLVRSKFNHVATYKHIAGLFSRNDWYAIKARSNAIMGVFKDPENLLIFLYKNKLVDQCNFNKAAFKKMERRDLLYFYKNYFIFIYAHALVYKLIKPMIPKFIWAQLKAIKSYCLGKH